jgi:hypothetical protein
MATLGLREAGTAQRNATHASHGLTREGQPWAEVSAQSARS